MESNNADVRQWTVAREVMISKLFQGCFSPKATLDASSGNKEVRFDRSILEARFEEYDIISKGDTWGQKQVQSLSRFGAPDTFTRC